MSYFLKILRLSPPRFVARFPQAQVLSRSKSDDSPDVANLRKPYNTADNVLQKKNFHNQDPYDVFDEWLKEACNTPGIEEPTAMTIATVSKEGKPTARMVLLKGYDSSGFNFYTNSRSVKGQNLELNPYAALVFYWEKLNRSIRIEGQVEMMTDDSITSYYSSRPRESQIAAHVSQYQSSPIPSRDVLLKRFEELEAKYENTNLIPRPCFWCGYQVKPDRFEFWQGQSSRMHDRIVFSKSVSKADKNNSYSSGKNGWFYGRLEP